MTNSLHIFSLGWVRLQISRLLVGLVFFILGYRLVYLLHLAGAIAAVSVLAIVICGSVALGFRWVCPRKITIVNRLAPVLLPLGFTIGRGKMRPIVICSWAGWTIIGSIGAIRAATGFRIINTTVGGGVMIWLLLVGLAIDGIGFLYLGGRGAKSLALRSPGVRPSIILMAILAGVMIASSLIWNFGWPMAGVIVAAIPPFLVGGFYGIFILFASKARWN